MKPAKFNISTNLSSSLLFHENRTFPVRPVRPVTQPIQKIGPQFPNVCLLSSDEQWEIDELVISVVHDSHKLSKLNATALEDLSEINKERAHIQQYLLRQQQMDFRLSYNNQDLDWVTDLNLDETMTPSTEFIVSGAEFNQKLEESLTWEMDLNQILEQSNSANLSAPNFH